MSQRLIEAHEEERCWIARELHDDINQRAALLTVDLERLKQNLPGMADLSQQLEERIKQLYDLAGDIQALSHRLHSSKLEYLGLRSAAAILCTELSDRQKVKIDFCSENIPQDLPISLFACSAYCNDESRCARSGRQAGGNQLTSGDLAHTRSSGSAARPVIMARRRLQNPARTTIKT